MARVEHNAVVEPTAASSRPPAAWSGVSKGAPRVREELRAGLVPVLLAFVVARLIASAALIIGGSENLSTLTYGWLDSWDGSWYRLIAIYGYDGVANSVGQTTWPFFPLLPTLSWGLQEVGIPERAAGLLVTNVAFVLSLAGVWVLARRHLSRRGALLSLWAVALFPMGVTFGMVYPSSLYLAGTVWAFVFVERRSDVAAALCAIVPTLARPNGFIVPLTLILAVWLRERDAPAARAYRAVAVAVPAGLAFLGWCALLWRWSGDPLIFYSEKSGWDEITIVEFVDDPSFSGAARAAWPHVLAAGMAVAVLVAAWRAAWFRLEWKVLTILTLVPPLLLGIIGVGRYAAECFPLALATGAALDRVPRRVAPAALAISGGLLAAFAVLVARHRFVP